MTTAVAGPRRRRSFALVWPPVVFGLAALVLWELLVTVTGIPAFLLPPPSAVAAQVVASFPTILSTAAVTGGNALVGLIAGFLLGVGLALLAARSRIVSELATPLVQRGGRGADRGAGPGLHDDVRLDHRAAAPAGGGRRGGRAGLRRDRPRARAGGPGARTT